VGAFVVAVMAESLEETKSNVSVVAVAADVVFSLVIVVFPLFHQDDVRSKAADQIMDWFVEDCESIFKDGEDVRDRVCSCSHSGVISATSANNVQYRKRCRD
jgi:hypothetical protein